MPLLTCPNCNVGMTQASRSGVEIDICPQCRGVWLDRGELEKLLEPLRAEMRSEAPRDEVYRREYDHHSQERYKHDDHHGHHDEHGRYGRRRSILDIFD